MVMVTIWLQGSNKQTCQYRGGETASSFTVDGLYVTYQVGVPFISGCHWNTSVVVTEWTHDEEEKNIMGSQRTI